jgi:hypothetical protein
LFDWVELDREYQAELVKSLRESWNLRVYRSEPHDLITWSFDVYVSITPG